MLLADSRNLNAEIRVEHARLAEGALPLLGGER
jgi:hypothetical protein